MYTQYTINYIICTIELTLYIFLFSDFSKASPLVKVYEQSVLEDYDYNNDYTNRYLFLSIKSSFKVSIPSKHQLIKINKIVNIAHC